MLTTNYIFLKEYLYIAFYRSVREFSTEYNKGKKGFENQNTRKNLV